MLAVTTESPGDILFLVQDDVAFECYHLTHETWWASRIAHLASMIVRITTIGGEV